MTSRRPILLISYAESAPRAKERHWYPRSSFLGAAAGGLAGGQQKRQPIRSGVCRLQRSGDARIFEPLRKRGFAGYRRPCGERPGYRSADKHSAGERRGNRCLAAAESPGCLLDGAESLGDEHVGGQLL
jgi:hypothetical protein